MTASIFGFTLPTFSVGLMLIMLFAVELQWVPVAERGDLGAFLGLQSSLLTLAGIKHVFLPALNLAPQKSLWSYGWHVPLCARRWGWTI